MEKNKKKEQTKVPEKKYYDVKVEVMVPALLVYRVLATDPEEAVEMMKRGTPTSVQYKLALKKNIKAMVYDAMTVMLRLVKKY